MLWSVDSEDRTELGRVGEMWGAGEDGGGWEGCGVRRKRRGRRLGGLR